MVTKTGLTFGIAFVSIGLSAYPAWADTLLEQMQNEVATIAGKARIGIVSIEDARAVVFSYNNSSLEKADLQTQLDHLQVDRAAAQEKAALEEGRYRAGLTTALEVETPRREFARLNTRLTFLQQKLANFGHEDVAAQQKRDLDARIAELEVEQKSYAQQIKLLEQQFAAGATTKDDLQAAQQQLAHVALDLTAAQAQRKAWTPNAPESTFFRWDNLPGGTPKSGSGFSVGGGYIVTTADVVQGMSSPIVTADDGRRIRATLVAVDGERNIGLVRLASNATLPALTLGDSDRVMPGHFAISIGNQAGQYNSVALGVVSGIRPQGFYSGAHFYPTLLQVDGAIGAGTSGAPILNARGEVVGMVAAVLAQPNPSAASGYVDTSFQGQNGAVAPSVPLNIPAQVKGLPDRVVFGQKFGNTKPPTPPDATRYAPVQTQSMRGQSLSTVPPLQNVTAPRPLALSAGTGFAIPINAMKDVIEELKAGKDIVHAWLGIALDDMDNAREESGIIRLNPQARIRGVYANSPASKVGMQAGDVLVSLNGKPVHTTSEVRAAILPMKAGQKVVAIVQRANKSLTFNLTLETQPTPRPALQPTGPVFHLDGSLSPNRLKPRTTP